VEDQRSPKKTKIYFLRRLPREPMHPDASLPAAQTWGLRSYDSAPDEPREGRDVFDIYSLSKRVGLNGIEYSQW
jgi:general secretion pathway protein G